LAQGAENAAHSEWDIFKANMNALAALNTAGCVRSAYPVLSGGVAASLALMAFGNTAGIDVNPGCFSLAECPAYQGSVLVEIDGGLYRENSAVSEMLHQAAQWKPAAVLVAETVFRITDAENGTAAETPLVELRRAYESPFVKVYPQLSSGGTVADNASETELHQMKERITEWISDNNIEKAKGKTRGALFSLFGNKLEPIASVPYNYLSFFDPDISDNRVYCGKGYFIDHAINHHPEVNPAEYTNIPELINNPDDVKLDNRFENRKSLIFIKKTEKYGVAVIGIGKTENGKLVFYKSFFMNKKNPYPQLQSIRTYTSLVDGLSTISRMDSIPAGSLSALNDTITIPDKTARVKKTGKGKAAPLVVLPVFPGTNCEWDMERAFRNAGAQTHLVIFRNQSRQDIAESIRELADAIGRAQILALSGGFSAGDEPDGSGKFIANVLRSAAIAGAVNNLLQNRDGLMLGICNGFQALIKLGLVPYGTYRPAASDMPTLTFNRIGRHVSRMARTRVMAVNSPWLALEEPGAVHVIPVSHGEGRIVMRHEEAEALFRNGQVPFCYADSAGRPALREPDNPNGSDFAIESLASPDGRILGKMGHSERSGEFVHINIPGSKQQRIFEAGVRYFKD
ncbi:MAG: phosphoribosylformylglycinamidine synthase subunit PurQ, partial [Treponema sp.]|nr:phosphoribosylformylglycinamidine synthase subunit PurQ [Treponema sp.]